MRIAWMLIALAPALLPNVARAQVNTEHDALSRRFATLVAPPPQGPRRTKDLAVCQK
jgi:hypothetical protein